MGKNEGAVGQTDFKCFTKEQNEAYWALTAKQRCYIQYRARGNSKSESYRMAFNSEARKAGQAAFLLEQRPIIATLIGILEKQHRLDSLSEKESKLSRNLEAKIETAKTAEALSLIENADGETARRIRFYRDIVDGKIKTVKKTVTKDGDGNITQTKIEESSDINVRINARKELDKILGMNQVVDIGRVQAGGITINIVDAGKKDELEDSRNRVVIDLDKVEDIDGETVLVTEEAEEKEDGGKNGRSEE